MSEVCMLVAVVKLAAPSAPQLRNGVVVNSGVHASVATCGDSAFAVDSDAAGSPEEHALEQIATAATTPNHFFDSMSRSS
jgi:hypothetical protein